MAPNSVICAGSALWDVIGRTDREIEKSHDVPGRIRKQLGGVALNVAGRMVKQDVSPIILSAVGQDAEGVELIAACQQNGIQMDHVLRMPDLPTDRYMAIEDTTGLVAAIADAHSLEKKGQDIFDPLLKTKTLTLSQGDILFLDGNFTTDTLEFISTHPALASTDIRIAPASPGKAERLAPFFNHATTTLYCNKYEAEILCEASFPSAAEAAEAMVAKGAYRAVITDGEKLAADAMKSAPLVCCTPPKVTIKQVTGAGDTLIATHVVAELNGQSRTHALEHALNLASAFVAGKT